MFKDAARFVMNAARMPRESADKSPAPDRESLTEFGNDRS